MRECAVEGCRRRGGSRGLCPSHYSRARRLGELDQYPSTMVRRGASAEERLRHHGWTVRDDTGCWEWQGCLNGNGYGQMAVGGSRPQIVSRVAFEEWVRPLEVDEVVCHRCDNPPCINPAHLFAGDRALNNRDMADKKRIANGENKRSHRLSDAQVAEIRARYAAGGVFQKALAAEYGVSQQLVSHVVRGTRRAHPTYRRPGALPQTVAGELA